MWGWLKRLGSSSQETLDRGDDILVRNIRAARHRIQVIQDYGKTLGEHAAKSGHFWDVNLLPHKKEDILDALSMEIVIMDDADKRGQLEVAAVSLADYQPGVGQQPMFILGVDLSNISLSDRNATDVAKLIAKNASSDKLQQIKSQHEQDILRIQGIISAANQLRLSMPEKKKRLVLGKGLI